MTTAVDGKTFSNIAATTAAFYLKGGQYVVAAVATFSAGNVELQDSVQTERRGYQQWT